MGVLLQGRLFKSASQPTTKPVGQLLKWVGNKQRFAAEIISYFPKEFDTYFEPFLGSGAVLGAIAPPRALASDAFAPLLKIWETLHSAPEELKTWYARRWKKMAEGPKKSVYETIKAAYNANPNGADLLFLCRSCYGGVVRFRKADGAMSTPCGIHSPINPGSFAKRVDDWHERTRTVEFATLDYREAMERARRGDMVYCDPPYQYSQSILYGAQEFRLSDLIETIEKCKARGVKVALSVDGKKKSGRTLCDLPIPRSLFAREAFISCGRSMLKRFQMNGKSLEEEVVSDRLLLTY